MTENSGPAIDQSIHVMPMFVNFVVREHTQQELAELFSASRTTIYREVQRRAGTSN